MAQLRNLEGPLTWRVKRGQHPIPHGNEGAAITRTAAQLNWDKDFAGLPPIDLPDDRGLETLACCRAYILALLQREHSRREGVVAELLNAPSLAGRSGLSRRCASHGRCMALRALVRCRSVVISVSLEGEARGPQMKEAAN
jgi:hypothetical protein